MGRLSLTTWLYIAAVVSAAGAILARVPVGTVPPGFWVIYGVLAVLFLICDSTPTLLGVRQWAWSPSSAATLAAGVMLSQFGGVGAAMVGAVAVLSIRGHVPVAERLFNGAMNAIAGFAAGTAYHMLDGQPVLNVTKLTAVLHGAMPPHHWFAMSLQPFAVAALTLVLVNHGLLWGMLLLDRHSLAGAQRAVPGWGLPLLLASDLGFAALGLVIAALWAVLGPDAAAIVLVPLYVARWAMAQFAEQQRAHTATLRALCQAVDTKDFYTRGHSERVSRGAGMIARQIGMRTDRAEAVRFAGMLHDVGKLGVPTKVLQK